MKTGRQPFLDNARFLAVVCVVVGHCLEPWLEHSATASGLYRLLYAFHVPVLVFLAGVTTRSSEGWRALWKIVRTLLLPYAIFQILYLLWDAKVLGRSTLHLQFHQPYWLLWFLPSLAAWRWMLPWFFSLRFRTALALSVAIALGAGLFPEIGYSFSASRTLVFFPFFLAGAHPNERVSAGALGPTVRVAGVAVLALACGVFLGPWHSFDTRWLYARDSYSAMGISAVEGVGRRAGVLGMAAVLGGAFLACIPRRFHRWTPRGARTLQIYLWHGFIVRGAAPWIPVTVLQLPGSESIAIVIGIFLSWLLSMRTIRTTL